MFLRIKLDFEHLHLPLQSAIYTCFYVIPPPGGENQSALGASAAGDLIIVKLTQCNSNSLRKLWLLSVNQSPPRAP